MVDKYKDKLMWDKYIKEYNLEELDDNVHFRDIVNDLLIDDGDLSAISHHHDRYETLDTDYTDQEQSWKYWFADVLDKEKSVVYIVLYVAIYEYDGVSDYEYYEYLDETEMTDYLVVDKEEYDKIRAEFEEKQEDIRKHNKKLTEKLEKERKQREREYQAEREARQKEREEKRDAYIKKHNAFTQRLTEEKSLKKSHPELVQALVDARSSIKDVRYDESNSYDTHLMFKVVMQREGNKRNTYFEVYYIKDEKNPFSVRTNTRSHDEYAYITRTMRAIFNEEPEKFKNYQEFVQELEVERVQRVAKVFKEVHDMFN